MGRHAWRSSLTVWSTYVAGVLLSQTEVWGTRFRVRTTASHHVKARTKTALAPPTWLPTLPIKLEAAVILTYGPQEYLESKHWHSYVIRT